MRPLETIHEIRMQSELACTPAVDRIAIAAPVCHQVSHLVPVPARDAAMAYFLEFFEGPGSCGEYTAFPSGNKPCIR